MKARRVFFDNQSYAIYGDPTDSYFRSGFASDGWRSCGYHFREIIDRNSICIDVGANIGITSIGFATLAAKVYAIEPSPPNFRLLTKNIEANSLKNIYPFKIAIAEQAGELPFYDTTGFRAGSFLCKEKENVAARHHSEDGISVETMSLDQFVLEQNIDRVNLIKVDVEGFEHEVLLGALATIRKFRPVTVLEFNPYCLVSHANYLPTRFIDLVFDIFDEVYVHIEQLNSVTRASSVHEKHNLLHDAFRFGLVNLICSFNDAQFDPKVLSAAHHRRVLSRIKNKLRNVFSG